MAEKYYIINPTSHVLQIYDIARILPGTEDEPTITECTITNQADLEAIKGIEGWGLKLLSESEYEDIVTSIEEEEEEEVMAPPAKVRVSNSRKSAVKPEIVEFKPLTETEEAAT